ncbi:MAG: D-2-hydroxyacid dehydrogenase [Candidatus Eiseniibacteriota bacterium]|nr:MAG: D-2-hydroxyacid dehydrogenase [Candidatus Eisenbacteria bacterium]
MRLLIVNQRAPEYAALIKKELPDLEISVAKNKSEIPPSIEDVDIILAWRVPKDVLKKAVNVRWLASTGAGVDHLILPWLGKDVVITKAPPIFGRLIAEYVMGYALHVSLGVENVLSNKQKKLWAVPERSALGGRLMGILGMGSIGTEIARAARCMGMKVWGVRRSAAPSPDADRVFGPKELKDFLPHPDFLVIALPLTEETRDLIGSDELSLVKSTAWIINVGRGRVLGEEALVRKLGQGGLGGYVADVFATEPLPKESPLWELSNVIITPHYAALTSPEEFVPSFVDNVRRFEAGRPLLFQIDRQKGY